MKKTITTTRQLSVVALVAALYAALSLALPVASFGAIQMRPGEALSLLAAFSPLACFGLTLGCFLTNLVGLSMGLTIAPDLFFGTVATLLAAFCSYLLRNVKFREIPFLIWLPPVLCNALILPLEWMLFTLPPGEEALTFYLLSALYVAAGQAAVCLVLGMPLFLLAKNRLHADSWFSKK